eukprot:gene1407-biopygen1265
MACSLRERGEVLRWIHKGTGICWISEAPLRLDHEVLLANAILRQVECATVLGNRRVGATEETPTYFQGVPGAQAGDEQAVSSYGLHMGQLALPEDATQDGVTQEFVAACQTGEWEPTQLENENVELEVDLKAEQFKVTPARLQKIFQQAMALLSKAETVASSQRWTEEEWHRHTVNRFASKLSANLLRYDTQWYGKVCEGMDTLAYSRQDEVF